MVNVHHHGFSILYTMIVVAAAGAGDLIESHQISLATLVAVGSVVLPAAWWLSAKFTKIDDSLDDLKVAAADRRTAIEAIKVQISGLRCNDCNWADRNLPPQLPPKVEP